MGNVTGGQVKPYYPKTAYLSQDEMSTTYYDLIYFMFVVWARNKANTTRRDYNPVSSKSNHTPLMQTSRTSTLAHDYCIVFISPFIPHPLSVKWLRGWSACCWIPRAPAGFDCLLGQLSTRVTDDKTKNGVWGPVGGKQVSSRRASNFCFRPAPPLFPSYLVTRALKWFWPNSAWGVGGNYPPFSSCSSPYAPSRYYVLISLTTESHIDGIGDSRIDCHSIGCGRMVVWKWI